MGFFDKIFNGATDVVTGPVEFIADGFQATETLFTEGPTEALGQVLNSFQEEILGQTMGGLFGPEGIGGAVFGAIPEPVRNVSGNVIDPVFGAWDWTVQELVDRPLGTLFTVVNATANNGIQNLFDLETYAKAWEINDKRTFGQSLAASLYMIDPFDEDEYNSIQDDPLFNLVSGTADFVQEFIDPVTIIGGTAFKAARGAAVFGPAQAGRRGSLIGRPKDITRVYGGRTGFRPVEIFGKQRGFLTKTEQQLRNRERIIQSHTAQRAKQFTKTKDYGRIESVMSKLDSVDDRFTAFKQVTGKASKRMGDDAIRLFANAETAVARERTMRALTGDTSVLEEVSKEAKRLREIMQGDNWEQIAAALKDPKMGDAVGVAEFRELAEKTDWAVMSQFREALFKSQQIALDFDSGLNRYVGTQKATTFASHAAEHADETLAALESIAAQSKDVYGSVLGMAQTPWGSRLDGILRRHAEVLEQQGDRYVVSEFANPHTVGGALGGPFGRAIRVLTERVPQSVIFFNDASVVRQFERVITQAERINVGGAQIVDAQEAGRLVSSFQALKMQNDVAGMSRLYENTVRTLNSRLDELLHESGIEGIDKTKRALTDAYDEQQLAWMNESEKARTVGVTEDGADFSVTVRRQGEDSQEYIIHHRYSPSQVKASMVQPRYDIVQRQIEMAQARAGRGAQKVAVTVGDVARGSMTRLRPVLDTPQQAWRQSMLLRPAWPMRVGLDEQLRAMADMGALTTLGNLVTAFPEMRRAFALHNLAGIDEATDIEQLTRVLRERAGQRTAADQIDDITRQLDEQLEQYGRVTDMPAAEGARRTELMQQRMRLRAEGDPSLLDLLEAAGPDGLNDAVKQLTREKVLAYRNQTGRRSNLRRLGRNAALKGGGVGLFMGNPVLGAVYGFAAYAGKRRRINQALERKAALNYAGALRNEAELMLRQITDADGGDLAAIRKLQDDASYIEELVQREIDGASTVRNAFDAAEELMQEAGIGGVHIGGVTFRNAFGDDPRYQEQIRANVSASRSQSAVYSGARADAQRQVERFQDVDWRVFDALEDGDISKQWERMMNQYTSRDIDQKFYQVVWSNDDVVVRKQKLTELLENDEPLLRSLSNTPTGSIPEGGIGEMAGRIIDEYEAVLPSGEFAGLRDRARVGEIVPWSDVTKALDANFGKKMPLKEQIEAVRAAGPRPGTYENFGKATSPEPLSHTSSTRREMMGRAAEHAESLFKMFGTLPTDELARNPMFRVKYERELRRRIELMADDDGMVRLSQRNINEIEQQARDAALLEVRELMYDLAENTRISEMVGNAMPFFNAWQEVIGRWAGLSVQNPTFVGNAIRIYKKPWEAETLGISEITTEDAEGNVTGTYLAFRPFGPAFDEDGNETTIFEAMSPKMRNLLIPKPLRDQNATVRFSKDGLNTVVQAPVPGFGPLITIPVREAILKDPSLEETFGFMFPFGHPEGGFFERAFIGNLPTWGKALVDYGSQSQSKQRLVQRMFQDIVVERAAAGEPLDWNNDLEVQAAIDLANDRAKDFFIFRAAAGLFSPSSTTLLSPYEPLVQEARKLQREHGTLIGNDMFLDKYGEDFFALTARMTKLNDGVAASIDAEENYMRHQDLVQAHPEVGAWITGGVGATDEQMVFSQAVYRRQQNMELAPGSDQTRRERKTPLEAIGDTQADLGWRAYTELRDFVRSKQDEAIAAGMSGSLNSSHMAPVRLFQEQKKAELALKYPQWAEQERDFTRSARRTKAVVEGFAAGLQDPQIMQRPSSVHLIEYFELRMFVQRQLQARDAAGGSDSIGARSNEDLQTFWEAKKEELGMRPQFSPIYDRFFERDRLDRESFVQDDAFEGLL